MLDWFKKLVGENVVAPLRNDWEVRELFGILQKEAFQKAENNLAELKSGTSIYKNKATWYLALSKLKQKDYKTCKEILLTIPDDYEDYDQVQELLSELD
mgnify:CR=1 FL=1